MEIKINSEYIKLGQFLKYINIISTGGEEKAFLSFNTVLVNGEDEKRRGKKLYPGDEIKIKEQTYRIK